MQLRNLVLFVDVHDLSLPYPLFKLRVYLGILLSLQLLGHLGLNDLSHCLP